MSKLLQKDEIKNPYISENPLMLLLVLEENADTLTLEELLKLRNELDILATQTNVIANMSNPETHILDGKDIEAHYLTSNLLALQTITTDKYLDLLEYRIREVLNGEALQPYDSSKFVLNGGSGLMELSKEIFKRAEL